MPGNSSVDLLIQISQSERQAQLSHFDSLDSKAGLVLGFAGVLIALDNSTSFGPGTARTARRRGNRRRFDDFSQLLSIEHGAVSEKFAQIDRRLVEIQSTFEKRDGVIDERTSRIWSEVISIVSLLNNDRTRGT